MSDAFETLGVSRRFTLNPQELEQRHRDLSRALHPDRHVSAAPAERRVAMERAIAVNDAFRTLRDPLARALALLKLRGVTIEEGERASPALLMEIMELREELESARGKSEKIARLRGDVSAHIEREHRALADALDRDGEVDKTTLARAREAAVKLKYLRRFEEEADAMED